MESVCITDLGRSISLWRWNTCVQYEKCESTLGVCKLDLSCL